MRCDQVRSLVRVSRARAGVRGGAVMNAAFERFSAVKCVLCLRTRAVVCGLTLALRHRPAMSSSRVQFYEFVICLLERCIKHIASKHCMCSSSNVSSGSPQWEPVYCCKQRLSAVAGLHGRCPPQPGGRDPVTPPSLSQT